MYVADFDGLSDGFAPSEGEIQKSTLETKIVNKSVSLLSKSKSEKILDILDNPKTNKASSLIDCLVN